MQRSRQAFEGHQRLSTPGHPPPPMTRADPGDAEDITAELALNVMCCAPRQKAAALEMPLLVRLTADCWPAVWTPSIKIPDGHFDLASCCFCFFSCVTPPEVQAPCRSSSPIGSSRKGSPKTLAPAAAARLSLARPAAVARQGLVACPTAGLKRRPRPRSRDRQRNGDLQEKPRRRPTHGPRRRPSGTHLRCCTAPAVACPADNVGTAVPAHRLVRASRCGRGHPLSAAGLRGVSCRRIRAYAPPVCVEQDTRWRHGSSRRSSCKS